MSFPTPKVSIAFDDGPYVANPTWTDITSYVYSADVSRGRADDYSQFIGTAQVVLNNNSRLFDPFYTSGTYYGKLLPRRQIKIEGVSNSVTYPVFRGFVDGFPAAWDQAGKFATTTLSCFDGLSLLSAELVPDYVYDYTISLAPTHYYRMNDVIGTTVKDFGSNPLPLTATSQLFQKNGSIVPALQSQSINFSGNEYTSGAQTYDYTNNNTKDMTFAMWVAPNSATTLANFETFAFGTDANSNMWIDYRSTGAARGQCQQSTTTATADTTSTSIVGSAPYHLAFTYDKTTRTVAMYVNGQLNSTGAVAGAGNFYNNAIARVVFKFYQYQEVSMYLTKLTAAQILDLYNYSAANIQEDTDTRMARLLSVTSWPASLQDLSTNTVGIVSTISLPNSNLVAEMQLVNNSEDGDLFVTRAGVIKFTDRNYVYTNTSSNTSQATFASGSIPFQPSVKINYDAAAIRNDITVTFSGNGQTSTTNVTSVTAYGTNAMNTSTQLSTQAQAVTLAAYQAAIYGLLLTNISPVSVGVTAATSDWSTLLGLELLDRYTITVQPPTGNSISQTELINRIEHRIVPGQWQMTVDGSARFTALFALNDVIYGKLQGTSPYESSMTYEQVGIQYNNTSAGNLLGF